MPTARKVTFAARLAELRAAAALSQATLASRAGISQQSLSQLERGMNVATWPTVQALARALSISTEELRDD